MTPTKKNDEEFEWLLCLAAAFQASQRGQAGQPDEPPQAPRGFLNALLRAWRSCFPTCKWPRPCRRDGDANA